LIVGEFERFMGAHGDQDVIAIGKIGGEMAETLAEQAFNAISEYGVSAVAADADAQAKVR
jgi:hypothetical protein